LGTAASGGTLHITIAKCRSNPDLSIILFTHLGYTLFERFDPWGFGKEIVPAI
jgi:hypothetical protein